MNDTARRLRAQKAHSTDPDYLERLAREEEARGSSPSTVPTLKRALLNLESGHPRSIKPTTTSKRPLLDGRARPCAANQ
jgi:hypothetical protein